MSVYRVLDKLEAYVHEGTWLPAGYRILSEERLLELVEKIRASFPEEVGRAKVIAKDQDRMMRAAQERAQAIVDEAASKHEELVDQNEIVQRARNTADTVLREAEEQAQRIREGADRYAADVLAEHVLNPADWLRNAHVEATKAAVCQDTPGVGLVYSPRTPGIASLSEDQLRPAPDIGQDSREVLLEAGMGRDAIDDLVKSGVVRGAKGGET